MNSNITNFSNIFIQKIFIHIKSTQKHFEKIPKYARYSIALPILEKLFIILDLGLLARTRTGKSQLIILNKIDIQLQSAQIRLRILHTTDNLDQKSYIILSEELLEIGKILGGWIKKIQ